MMLAKADRTITIVDRGDVVIVIDARSGIQRVHRVPKREAKRVMVTTPRDVIVVDMATLTYTIEPPIVISRAPHKPVPAERPTKPLREQAAKTAKAKTKRQCKHLGAVLPDEVFPPREGLGDLLSDGLSAIGITKERWSALVNQGKAEGVCTGCDGRQTFVNWLGSKLGFPEGQGPALHKLVALTEIPTQHVQGCAVHGKCLTRMRGDDQLQAACKTAGFSWCNGCKDRELVTIEVPV